MAHKEMIYLKGYAKGKKMWNLLKALNCSEQLHVGQKRKDGEDYIVHPIRVTSSLVALGFDSEFILVPSILHDVMEDCKATYSMLTVDYKIHSQMIDTVTILTKKPFVSLDSYYDNIRCNSDAIIIKIADRCHNLSTMVGAFSIEKMNEYIQETEKYILPLCKLARNCYPEYSDQIFVMKYHIESICKAVTGFINMEGTSC